MLNQSFSLKELKRLFTVEDVKQHSLGKEKTAHVEYLEKASLKAAQSTIEFTEFHRHAFPHGTVVFPKNFVDEIIIRKLNDNIRRIYSVQPVDRNRILPQVKVLLAETGEFWVQKLDIKKFYESIDRAKIIQAVIEDTRISYDTRRILESFFQSKIISEQKGLPRGISLSSTLSEICMRDFDHACRTHQKCYFYTRYVDDILMLFHEQPGDIIHELSAFLPHGLQFNPEKCKSFHHPRTGAIAATITYLGYEFSYVAKNVNKPSTLMVRLAPKKVKRIKTRIVLALVDYLKTSDFDLLERRMRFLSSNYKIGSKARSGNLYAGIFFSNSLIDKEGLSTLVELDRFVQNLVFSKRGWLCKKLSATLTVDQKRRLCKNSLVDGFQKRIVRKFEVKELWEIKGVWQHV